MHQIDLHYGLRYENTPARFRFLGRSTGDHANWAAAFRPVLQKTLGLEQIRRDLAEHEPNAQMISSEDLGTYTRETWHLAVEPSVRIPFYYLHPKGTTGLLPLVVTPHGHNPPYFYVGIANNDAERERLRAQGNDVALQAVKRGYAVLAPTARGFGETRTEEDIAQNALSSCQVESLRNLLIGRTLMGERVWDTMRLIDWAATREEIDTSRIAITGNSGGGATSLFTAACDERISVVVPSSYFCTFQGSIGSISHCACNYVPGVLQLGEMYDIAGLIAPRSFRAIAGVQDPIFPIDQVRRSFEHLRRIYAAAGSPDNCDLYEADGGHRYYEEASWPFIAEHIGLAQL